MDATGPLESIAKLLPDLPEEAVESLLVTFDALVGVGNAACRPAAVQILRDTAALCPDGIRRERLLKAAGSLAAGEPCALTPDGLSWQQAAMTQTMTMPPPSAEPDEAE